MLSEQEQKDRRFAEAVSEAVAKGFQPLLEGKDAKVRPATYHGTKDGLIDSWILMMPRHLTKHHPNMSPLDKAWRIIEVLEG